METLTNDPDRDVTTIKVDLRLSTLKPCHVKIMTDMYQHLKFQKRKNTIKAGWRAAGIRYILKDVREGNGDSIRLHLFCMIRTAYIIYYHQKVS